MVPNGGVDPWNINEGKAFIRIAVLPSSDGMPRLSSVVEQEVCLELRAVSRHILTTHWYPTTMVCFDLTTVPSSGNVPWPRIATNNDISGQQTTNYTIVFPTHRHPTIHENIHDNESGILIRFLLRNPPHRDNGFMTRRHRIPVFMSFGVVIRSTSDRFVLDVSHRRRTKTSDELWRNSRKEQSSAEDKFGYRMSLLRWLKANRTERLENQTGGNLFIRLDLVTENILFGIRTRVGQHGRLE